MRQAVVIAGGLGTRLASNGIRTPKILLDIGGRKLIDRIILELENELFDEILFLLGEGADEIVHYLENLQTKIGIKTFIESKRHGTMGALVQGFNLLQQNFVVILGDLFIANVNLGGLFKHFIDSRENLAVLAKYTDHPEDSDLIEIDDKFHIANLHTYPHDINLRVKPISMAGIYFFRKDQFEANGQHKKGDISKDFLPNKINDGVRVYIHQGIVRDIGTLERLNNIHPNLIASDIHLKDHKFILLDRDGILNVDKRYIKNESDVELTGFARDLMAYISKSSLKFAIVTNQPAISHGVISLDQAYEITRYIVRIATSINIKFEEIYICPHHPDGGYPGEVIELKKDCQCRKPAPGLLLDAIAASATRGTNCLMIGDNVRDIVAALLIGAKAIHLHADNHDGSCFQQVDVICATSENIVEKVSAWRIS